MLAVLLGEKKNENCARYDGLCPIIMLAYIKAKIHATILYIA